MGVRFTNLPPSSPGIFNILLCFRSFILWDTALCNYWLFVLLNHRFQVVFDNIVYKCYVRERETPKVITTHNNNNCNNNNENKESLSSRVLNFQVSLLPFPQPQSLSSEFVTCIIHLYQYSATNINNTVSTWKIFEEFSYLLPPNSRDLL